MSNQFRARIAHAGRIACCLALVGCTVAGCTVGPDFEKPTPWWSPSGWFSSAPAAQPPASQTVAEPIDPRWWTLFGDPVLTGFEEKLADANLDVRVSTIRLTEARAQLGVTEAGRYPTANANSSYLRQQQSRNGVLSLSGSGPTGSNGLGGKGSVPNTSLFDPYDLFQYGFDASWELDFWGRIRRSVEASNADVQAGQEAQRDALVTVGAELARDYIQLRGVQRKLEITRQNLASARQSLQLTQQRAAGGVTTDLDVATAAAQVETTASQIPALEQQQAQFVNAIGYLLGEAPRALEVQLAAPRAIPPVPPRVPVGLPSDLVRRRPDIRRAEAQLHSATADVGVAVADFFPRFSLSGSAAIQAVQFRNLANGSSLTYGLGPTVTLPIFEGGRLRRTLDLRKAQQQEAAIDYQRTVLGALRDVDDAMTSYETEQRRRTRLQAAVAQNRRALGLARDRYEQGVTDFLNVLTAQRNLLDAEQQLADSTATVSTNLVQLYKSLGGGWESQYPEDKPAAAKM